ncbi:MAG: serine/threonine-protein phosphatase [Saprospirales bacterium]|nr:MAG: serine/threonine-protein phosphatase [Saprospirales bacterium]
MKVLSFNFQGKRPSQQDRIWISDTKDLFVICDGVGGTGDGAAASQMVVDYFQFHIQSNASTDFPSQFPGFMRQLLEILRDQSEVRYKSFSTTIALAYFAQPSIYFYHLGDSRIFHMQKSTGHYWISKDHSVVQDLYEIGALKTEEEMRQHPLRNRITKALSSEQVLSDEEFEFSKRTDIKAGDLIFICTDGVLENYDNQSILDLFMSSGKSPEEAFTGIEETSKTKSKDNSSCVLIMFDEE